MPRDAAAASNVARSSPPRPSAKKRRKGLPVSLPVMANALHETALTAVHRDAVCIRGLRADERKNRTADVLALCILREKFKLKQSNRRRLPDAIQWCRTTAPSRALRAVLHQRATKHRHRCEHIFRRRHREPDHIVAVG